MFTMKIGPFDFWGPYDPRGWLPTHGGVYVPLFQTIDGHYCIVDVGETSSFSERLPYHERAAQWEMTSSGTHSIWLHPMVSANASDRRAVEKYIRLLFNPPCGDR